MAWTGDRLILASSSPTRRRLLGDAGLEFIIEPARIDEATIKARLMADGRSASDCALALAEAKARQVAANYRCGLVIGADQILVCGGEWFDKPANLADARWQLQALRGLTHQLVTAACVVQQQSTMWQGEASAKLTMREFSDAFLDTYLADEATAILGLSGRTGLRDVESSSLRKSKVTILRFSGFRSWSCSVSCGSAVRSPHSRVVCVEVENHV
jgi:septum formation protein